MTTPKVAVKVDKLVKTFRIPTEQSSGIKQKLINALKGKKGYREFTPLNGVSFEIHEGDFFGIVGRNGSGKSTLLKSIASIYKPTSGGVHVEGSLVPFIELGVGFNPELTGRENVFLNGALLGFSRDEVSAMYDKIVDFAEIGDFMEEKLKNYSSGMQVRLAFSIAIQAKGDILLLDEVLAVGDEAFQRKCFDYFQQLRDQKKTVILVSHDMGSVKKFCTKAMLIENGEIKVTGTPDDVAKQYTLDNLSPNDHADEAQQNKGMSVSGNVTSIHIKAKSPRVLTSDNTLEFDVEYEYLKTIDDLYLGISLLYNNIPVIEHGTIGVKPISDTGKKITYRYRLPLNRFIQGNFVVTAAVLGVQDRNLVAFTKGIGNFAFTLVNNGKPKGGLLDERGEWV